MKNKIKYLLVLMCFMVLPMTVSAHTFTLTQANATQGETSYGVYLETSSDLSEQTTIKISNCSAGNNVSCTATVGGDGVSSAALTESKSSGEKFKIGTIVLKSSGSSDVSGTVNFKVTIGNSDPMSASGSYTVKAARTLSTSSKFKTVTLSQGTVYPAFSADTLDYTVYNLKDTINSVTINYTCDNCTISVDETAGSYKVTKPGSNSIKIANLESGDNNVTIKVTSEDGSKSDTYTFRVIRGKTDYDSAELGSLSVGEYDLSPSFKSATTEYSVSVPYKVDDVESLIDYELLDEGAEATIEGASNLKVGENTVTINITSVNGDNTATYTLTVTRLSSDDIIIKKYKDKKITFTNADGEEETLTVDEFKEQYPTIWQDIEDDKYEFDEDGNVVTDDDEDKKSNSTKVIVIVVIVIIALAVIVIAGILLFKKKDPKKEAAKKAKKEAKRKAKEERKREEAEYYGEEYDDEDEYETDEESENDESEETEEESTEIEEEDKLNKEEAKSLLEDDYIFGNDEEEAEEEMEERYSSTSESDIVDVDTALEDLMNTKTYDFSDELKDVRDMYDDEDKD